MDFDDGFIAYLNGIEIARSNMAVNPAYNALATASHEAQLYQGYQPNYYLINAQALDTILKMEPMYCVYKLTTQQQIQTI